MHSNKTPYFDFSSELDSLEINTDHIVKQKNGIHHTIKEDQQALGEIEEDLRFIADSLGVDLPCCETDRAEAPWDDEDLNLQYDKLWRQVDTEILHSVSRLPKLSKQDLVVCSCIGLLASLVDFFLVGIPHKGHSTRTGSPLTDVLRKIGKAKDGKELSPLLKWLEKKCKVPYDISSMKNVMYPGNHRMRSFAHDPFFGLFFAVFDCIYGTCTCIDNSGNIRIITGQTKPNLFPIILYFGHLVSDVCTSSGLPVPGWVFTQLLTSDDSSDLSIARIAESMYRDGYDFRHFISMSSSVKLSRFFVHLYISFQQIDSQTLGRPLYETELRKFNQELMGKKMLLITNTVASSGNLIKFVAPPSNGNPAAINLPQWGMLLKNSLQIAQVACRDRTTELIAENRRVINESWHTLGNV